MSELKRLQNGGNYYYFSEPPTHASSITLNETRISLTTAGQTEQLTATVVPDDAIDKYVSWSSSNTSIATVTPNGLVTCITPGNCTITASCDGVSATCSVSVNKYVDFLIVGGGGGGGNGRCYYQEGGGGGGAGGVIQCTQYMLSSSSYTITIGAGGGSGYPGCNGGDTCFGNIVAKGGGGGAGTNGDTSKKNGLCGGSGGGGTYVYSGGDGCGGTGTNGQGYNGGDTGNGYAAGGGGGAGQAGGKGCTVACQYSALYGYGGCGILSDISGEEKWYAGGGGGGYGDNTSRTIGGCGGGGCGGGYRVYASSATYYGGGGGGAPGYTTTSNTGGSGYQGIVIIRYPTACGYNITGGCKYTCGDYTIHCFTSDGTLTIN